MKRFAFLALLFLLCPFISHCGGGGGGSRTINPVTPPTSGNETGKISGAVETEPGESLSRAAGRETAQALSGAKIYAFPKGASHKLLKPDSSMPNATAASNGSFTINDVPAGGQILVVDANADGIADERVYGITVSTNQTANVSVQEISTLNVDPQGSWCDVTLDKVNYSPGETIVMSLKGYNYGSYSIKCGVKIVLRKGQNKTELWRSDFSDSSAYIIAANAGGTRTISKTIPANWEPTNSQGGSDYRVYTIRENGDIWSKGDNFNIICSPACTSNTACDDGKSATTDICANAGTCGAVCTHVTCTPACSADSGCDDSNPLTTDRCNNPGTCDASCSHTACNVACTSNSQCDDGNAGTTDMCVNAGMCNAVCTHTTCAVACASNAACDDGNALTNDNCAYPGTCFASCSHIACTPACTSDTECNDSNALTVDTCNNPNTCLASCRNAACTPACTSDAGCDDGDALTNDGCQNPNTCSASCSHIQCTPACSSNTACDDDDNLTSDVCNNPGTCNASCAHYCSDLPVTSGYFPLAVGDSWSYNKSDYTPDTTNTATYQTMQITGCKDFDGKKYYEAANCVFCSPSSPCACYFRIDNNEPSKIYLYIEGDTEYLFLDTNAPPGTTLQGTYITPTKVCRGDALEYDGCYGSYDELQTLTVTSPYGTLTDCKKYAYSVIGSGWLLWVCNDVGISKMMTNESILTTTYFRHLTTTTVRK